MNKKILVFVSVAAFVFMCGQAYSEEGTTQTTNQTQTTTQAPVQAGAPFHVKELVICASVENRAPVGTAQTFSESTQKVYAFLDATKITEDTQVTFVWTYNQKEVSKFEVPLKKSVRWRTFASKTVSGMKGDWIVELKDANGTTVEKAQFKVE